MHTTTNILVSFSYQQYIYRIVGMKSISLSNTSTQIPRCKVIPFHYSEVPIQINVVNIGGVGSGGQEGRIAPLPLPSSSWRGIAPRPTLPTVNIHYSIVIF